MSAVNLDTRLLQRKGKQRRKDNRLWLSFRRCFEDWGIISPEIIS